MISWIGRRSVHESRLTLKHKDLFGFGQKKKTPSPSPEVAAPDAAAAVYIIATCDLSGLLACNSVLVCFFFLIVTHSWAVPAVET